MNEESMSFVFGLILLIFLSSTGLLFSEKREIERLENNFVARMSAGEFDKAIGVTSDNFQWVKFADKDKDPEFRKTHTAKEFADWIRTMPDRTGVDYRINDVKKLSNREYVLQTEMMVRFYTATHNSTLHWRAQCRWQQIGSTWQMTELMETSEPSTNVSN